MKVHPFLSLHVCLDCYGVYHEGTFTLSEGEITLASLQAGNGERKHVLLLMLFWWLLFCVLTLSHRSFPLSVFRFFDLSFGSFLACSYFYLLFKIYQVCFIELFLHVVSLRLPYGEPVVRPRTIDTWYVDTIDQSKLYISIRFVV